MWKTGNVKLRKTTKTFRIFPQMTFLWYTFNYFACLFNESTSKVLTFACLHVVYFKKWDSFLCKENAAWNLAEKNLSFMVSFFCNKHGVSPTDTQILMPTFDLKPFHSTLFISFTVNDFQKKCDVKISQKRFEALLKLYSQMS